jgi:NDP-sugar pyrophosphorylase family protein
MKAMILAAGIGSRLKELTSKTPKALIKVKDKTLLEIVIENLKSFGIEEIIINVYHFAQQIIDFAKEKNNFGIRLEFSLEEKLLDTGGGLKKASWFFENHEPFLLHNVDVISDINLNKMVQFHKSQKADITIAVRSRRTSRYFLFDQADQLLGWKNESTGEKKIVKATAQKLNPFSFMGIHIISPRLFKYFPEQEKFSIIDFYLKISADLKIMGFRADKFSWIDCGRPANLIEAKEFI